ncbi:hypothetical protein H0H92_007270 [Tricholoma furcatifolium]|nr:hypothetical protein H0H92_007270 [Tricholoma furcatifolium]
MNSRLAVLELGSGAGLTSSRIAEILKDEDILIATDLPEIYFPELLAPLLRTLLHVTSSPFSSPAQADGITVVISYKLRSLSKETPFWSAFGLWFRFEPVLVMDASSEAILWQRLGASMDDPVFIFIGYRRPESFSWAIPESDSDLLSGRGAMGNNGVKSDDTFETLLLMTMDDINEQ